MTKKTLQRLELREGANIRIEALEGDLVKTLEIGKWPKDILDSENKEAIIRLEDGLKAHKKIYDQGTFLYFSIPRKEEGVMLIMNSKFSCLKIICLY